MNFRKIIFGIISIFIISLQVAAQSGVKSNSKPTSDSLKCIRQISVYKEFMQLESYADAMGAYQYVLDNCPAFAKYIYLDGEKLIKYRIEVEKDAQKKDRLVDTLLRLYDLRIVHFGQEGFVLGKKGIEMYTYRRKSAKNLQLAYDWIYKSLQLDSTQSQLSTVNHFMLVSAALTQAKIRSIGQFISDFVYISALTERMRQEKVDKIELAISNNEKIFKSVTNCEQIMAYVADCFKNPNTMQEDKIALIYLAEKMQCQNDTGFLSLAENLFSTSPTSSMAYQLYKGYSKINRKTDAYKYLNKAIELKSIALILSTDSTEIAKYYAELSNMELEDKKWQESRTHAQKALSYNPHWGAPYIIIANAYAASSQSCGADEFTRRAVYWAAVDKLLKAKTIDPTLASVIDASIQSYSAQFPKKADAFFYNVTEGTTYKIECWIQESTIARF